MCLHIYADSHRDRYRDRDIHDLENETYLL